MRIIAGQFRGRRLLPPVGDATRPITDRVKQSLFDILASRLEGARVFDCFAGTGSMGLECLSRGSAHATFFEVDRSAVTLLKQNIQTLDVEQQCTLVTTDLFQWFAKPANVPAQAAKADLIFFDPPYRFLRERSDALQRTAGAISASFLRPGGTLIFRHDVVDTLALPPFAQTDVRTYGSMTIELMSAAALVFTGTPAASVELPHR